jgi:ATP-dependent helicase HrpA
MAGTTDRDRIRELRSRLETLTFTDAHSLGRRLERLTRTSRGRTPDLAELVAALEAAELRVAARQASVPVPQYPAELPITGRREEIVAALREHQVLIVAGETGSGKTTQLPKMCLEIGRGVRGQIGHTQPRRLAARTVAERLAEELGTELGSVVGWTVRFTDRAGPDTLVRLMTDGILLAQIQRDPRLLAYDTLIVDEAHERSLNIDFILGYLHQLLPQRPDLKLVITSATIDPGRFAAHFATPDRPVPLVEVSGRTYPIEIRYRPLVVDRIDAAGEGAGEAEPRDQPTAVCDAVEELLDGGPGDVLVFLSGEREIRDTADALRARPATSPDRGPRGGPPVEILPLYARLSVADQHRVFAPHPGRRIVLATNVAETSLTVPGVRYVVDAGTARISRYNSRRKVQRLPIEAISQASANQRSGRCGRVAAGVCIRLYSAEDYAGRQQFTDPEILRTSLAAVILQMAALGLGEVGAFGFIDPPDRRSIADGVALLDELGALRPAGTDTAPRLTEVGRKMAALPVDPRLARMILAADTVGALREVIIIVAALSIQDPREYPTEKLAAARAKHARFADDSSDFLAWLNLWRHLREQQNELSSAAFRRLCTADFLHYLRVREWQDLVAQLRELAGGLDMRWNSSAAAEDHIHQALLTGLLTHVGTRDPASPDQTFLGTRNMRFAVFPGSGLARRPPRWVMAAELVETSRLFARTVARIQPDWVEPLAEHLVTRQYSEPRWDPDRGAVVATERVTLYGLPLVVGRRVDYARIDPELCRELFIRHALVEGEWRTQHKFFEHNQRLREQASELEERARRRGLIIDDSVVLAFYSARVPAEVVSVRHFDAWWRKRRRSHPHDLDLDPELLRTPAAGTVSPGDFPDVWQQGETAYPLRYEFAPGTDFDGVTLEVPLAELNRIRPQGLDWGVPGLREELVTALLRALPKSVRRSLSPATTYAAGVLPHLDSERGEPLTTALERELRARFGVRVEAEDWDLERVPGHLRLTFRVLDDAGKPLGHGKDLAALRTQLRPALQDLVATGAGALERTGLTHWPDLAGADGPSGNIPRSHEQVRGDTVVQGFPALVAEGRSVSLRVLTDPAAAQAAMWSGTRRLLLTAFPPPTKAVLGGLSNRAKLALAGAPHASGSDLFDDCAAACVDAILAEHGGPSWEGAGFQALAEVVRIELKPRLTEVLNTVVEILTVAQVVDTAVAAAANSPFPDAVADMRAQYDGLLHPGFVTQTGTDRLKQLPRYLRGIGRRLERLSADPVRDATHQATLAQLSREFGQFRAGLPAARQHAEDVVEIRWLLEELRISLFAQTLGTALPISEKRILKAMDEAESRS